MQAQKDWLTFEHYAHLRRWRSSRYYLKEIIRRFPATSWADKARKELPEYEEKVKKLKPQDREKDAK